MGKEKCLFTNAMVFKLIAEVQQRPCLWNKNDPNYTNKCEKNAAYEEIGAAIGVAADDARDKVRNLRIIFMQNYKKKIKKGDAERHQPKWKFYNAMLFMGEEATIVGNTDPICIKDEIEEKTDDDEENSEQLESKSNHSTSTTSAVKSPSQEQASKRYKQNDSDMAIAFSPSHPNHAKQSTKWRQNINQIKVPNEKFATEVVTVLDNIRDENIVKQAKARMRLILADAMAESARQDLAECENYYRPTSPISESGQYKPTTL